MADNSKLIEQVLNDSNQLIHVSDVESFSMMYANKAARSYSGHEDEPYEGVPCYKYMLGLDEQCPFCPLRQMGDKESLESEVNNGQQVFAVKTMLTEWNGKKAFIEYSWDITAIRRSEKVYDNQLDLLMASIPAAQGIIHLDLTADSVLGINGVSKSISQFDRNWSVNQCIRKVADFIPDEDSRKDFFDSFCLENLQKLFVDGRVTTEAEYYAYYDDGSVRPSRTYARLLMNPRNTHLECVFYGMDVSREKLRWELQQSVVSALSRDFRNVYLVNPAKDDLSIIKLDGYLTQGLDFAPEKRFPYTKSCARYIRDRVHPEDQAMMTEVMSAARVLSHLKNHDEYVGTYRILEKGETHYCQYKYVRVEGSAEVVAGFQNVDSVVAVERKRQEELTRLLEQDRFQKKIFSSLAQIYFGIYYVDLVTGVFSELVPTEVESVRNLIGQRGDAREKLKIMSERMVVPEHASMVSEFTNLDTLADRLAHRDSVGVHFNGVHMAWCEGLFVSVERDGNGRCTKALWVLRSIKEEMAREEAYKERLKEALQKAEQASDAKSGFLTRMSHDIRTPLNGIIGILDMADKRLFDTDLQVEYRKKARVAANHLLSLLNDVLEMSKLEGSEIQFEEEPFNLHEILSEVYTIANLRAGENGVSIRHDQSVNLKYLNLYGSPLHVRQVFLNLLTNAIKYNKMGGSVFCHSEIVEEGENRVVYRFHVDDNGIGMKPEFLEHIFEPFAQERNDARSKFQGTGMGMAIVKRLVEKMHGTISVESEYGKGSRFAVTIPFGVNHNPQVQEIRSAEGASLDGMHVLLVEDNELNMEIAQSLLTDMGVVVTCARDGAAAVRIFETMQAGSIDLILMDLMMPVLDGYGATKKIRLSKKKDGSQIPIVALSANAFAEDVKKSKDAGMNDHLAKPINIAQLRQTLAKYRR